MPLLDPKPVEEQTKALIPNTTDAPAPSPGLQPHSLCQHQAHADRTARALLCAPDLSTGAYWLRSGAFHLRREAALFARLGAQL